MFQDFAPSPFHMRNVAMKTLRKMEIDADLEIVRPGYVPAGN
jgi:RNA 3'-terminal phosphate cyclase